MTKTINGKQTGFAPVWATVLAVATGHFLTLGAAAETPPSAAKNFNLAGTLPIVSSTKSGTVQVGGTVGANGVISGGTAMNITAGQLLTPAMNAALWQTSRAAAQSLQLNQAGAAIGGSATLNSSWAGNLSSLVVPAGVSVNAINYTTANPLNVASVANILGSVHVLQSMPGVTAALNFNSDLNLGVGALLSGNLPANLSTSGLFSSQNMILNVLGNLDNQGAISVAGNLSATVAGNINNITAAGSPTATISAQNITLTSGSGNIINSGLISALNTLNINTIDPSTNLSISNAGGVLEAVGGLNPTSGLFESGILNIRADGADLESANVKILDGKLRAAEINAFGRNVNVFVDQIDGRINIKGSAAHVNVAQGDLTLGEQFLTGDPTYSSINGNIVIDGSFITTPTFPDLAIIAGGSITDTSSGLPFGLNSSAGGSILIAAGVANITANLVNDTSSVVGFTTSPSNFTGGGSIIFSGMLKNGINTSSATTGGNVTLLALRSFNPTAGRIDIQNGGINASGFGANNNGNVTIIANADTGSTAIQNIGTITSGGTGTGDVFIAAATPVNNVVTVKDGAVLSGSFTATPAGATGGAISLAGIDAPGKVTVRSNGPVAAGSIGLGRTASGVSLLSTLSTVSAAAIRSSGDILVGGPFSSGVTLTGNITGVAGTGNGEVNVVTGTGGIDAAGTSITAFGLVLVGADSGDVNIGNIDNTAGSLKTVNVVASTGKTTVGSVNSSGGAVLIGNALTGSTGIVLNGDINNSASGAGGDVIVATTTGGVSGAGRSINSDGNVTVSSLSSVNSGNVSIGAITNISGSGTVGVGAISGTTTVGAITSGGQVLIGNNSTGAGVTLTGDIIAGSNSSVGVQIITATGGISGAGRSITADGSVSIAASSLANSGAVSIGNIDNSSVAQDVGIVSESGTVSAGAVLSGGQINIGSMTATGITLNGPISTSSKSGVTVRTSTGGVSGAGATITVPGTVFVTANDSVNSGDVSIGVINNAASSNDVFIDAASGVISSGGVFSGGNVFVGSLNAKGIKLTGNIESGGGGGVNIRTSTGGISAAGSTIVAVGPVTVAADDSNNSGAVSIGSIDNSSGSSDVFIRSQSGTVLSGGVISGGNVNIGSIGGTGVTLTGDIESAGKLGVTVRTSTGGISAAGIDINASGTITVSADDLNNSGAVSIGNLNNVSGTADVFVRSQGGPVLAGGVFTGGNVTIGSATGTGVTLVGNIESDGKSGVSVRTSTGGISAAGTTISSGGPVAVTAQDVNNSGNVSIGKISNFNAANDDVTIFAVSGSVSSGGVVTAGNVSMGVAGTTGVTLTGDIDSAGMTSVNLRATTGSISAAGTSIKGANDVFVIADQGKVSVGSINAGGDIIVGNVFGGTGITLGGNITSAGPTGVDVRTGTGGIDGAKSNITATQGGVNVSASDFVNSGAVSIGAISSALGVFIDSQTGTVSSGPVLSSAAVMIGNKLGTKGVTLNGDVAGATSVLVQTVTGGIAAGNSNISSAGTVTLVATNLFNSGAISVGTIAASSAASDVVISSTSGTVSTGSILTGGNVTIGNTVAARGVTLTGDISSGGPLGVTVNTLNGGIAGGAASINANGPVSLFASDAAFNSGAISINNISTSDPVGDVTVNAASGAVSTGNILTGGNVFIGNLLNGRGVTLNGDITSGGTLGVQVTTLNGGIAGGAASISALGPIALVASDFKFNSGAVNIGNILGSTAKSDVTVLAASGTVSTGAIFTAGNVTIGDVVLGRGVTLNGDITSGGTTGVLITTFNGGIDGSKASITAAGPVTIVAGDSTFNSGNVSVGPMLVSGASSDVIVDAKTGIVSSAGIVSAAKISIGNSTTTRGVVVSGPVTNALGNADVAIFTQSGGISSTSDILASGNLNIIAGSAVSLSGKVASENADVTVTGQATFGKNAVSMGDASASGSLAVTANGGGNLRVNAVAVAAGASASLVANTTGTVTFNGGTLSTVGNQTFTGSAVSIGAFSTVSSSNGDIDFNSDRVTIGPFATISANEINFNGQTTNGKFALNTNMQLSNSGTIQSNTGDILVSSASGQELRITGDGSGRFISPVSSTVDISTPLDLSGNRPALILGPGNQEFIVGNGQSPGADVTFSADTITIGTGVTYLFSNDFTHVALNTKQLNGNPGQFVIHPNGGNSNSTITIFSNGGGTIANSTGPVDLGFVDLSFSGPIAILSATDIISQGPLTIRVSGTGANINLFAGFDFVPATTGTEGPDAVPRVITGVSAGGSIILPDVDIQTDSFGAGDIFAVAAKGSTAGSGAISLGSLSSGGTQGFGGDVRLLANNGISVGSIDTRGPLGSGTVDIQSFTGLVGGGLVLSGQFFGSFSGTGATNGAVSLIDVRAGSSSITLRGTDVSSLGTIIAKSLSIVATNSVGPLTTELSSLSVVGGPTVDITNTGNLGISGSTKALSLVNTGNLTLTGSLSAGSNPVDIIVSGGTFANAGNTLSAPGKSVTITTDDINLTGSNSISANTVTLQPLTATLPIRIGSKVGTALSISTAMINSINASKLDIGSTSTTGGIVVANPLTVTKSFNLNFLQGAVSGNAFTENAAITITGGGTLSVTALSGNISLASVSNSTGAVIFKTAGASSSITLNSGLPSATGISLDAGDGSIIGLPQSPTVLAPLRDAGGNGGSLTLSSSNLGSMNLKVDVSGTGTGNGGSFVYNNTSTAALTLSSSNLQVNASGNNAGAADIRSGGNLTINPSGLVDITPTGTGAGNGFGGSLLFTSGVTTQGNLLILGNLSANGAGTAGVGGTISLRSNSLTTFNIGATQTTNINGIRGSLSVLGAGAANGDLTVANKSGSIINATQALTAVGNITFDTTGAADGRMVISRAMGSSTTNSINIIAGGVGSILPGGNVLTGNTVNLRSNSGAITANVDAATVSGNTGGAASVSITNRRAGLLTVNDSSSGNNFTLRNTAANSGISLAGGIVSSNTTTSTVALTATGTGSITSALPGGTDFIQGRTVTLTTGTGSTGIGTGISKASALRVRATNIGLNTTGVINVDNLGLNSTLMTVTAARPSSTFSLRSTTAVRVNPALTNATAVLVDTSAGAGGITMQGTVGSNKTETVDLTTAAGSITGNGVLFANNSSTGVRLTTTTGSVGTATTAVRTNTPLLSVLSGNSGLINISDAFTGGITLNSALTSTGGAITYSGSSATAFTSDISANGAVTLKTTAGGANFAGNITGSQVTITTAGSTSFAASKNVTATNGAIAVTESTGLMNIGNAAKFSATSTGPSAKITLLEKANVTGAGITIGDGAQLITAAGGVKGGTGGQISIVIGASVPAKVAGTQPGNVTVDLSKAANPLVNKVYWGNNSANVLTPGSNVNKLAIIGDTAIQFSAGSTAKITLAGNTQITADPPVGNSAGPAVLIQNGPAQVTMPMQSPSTESTPRTSGSAGGSPAYVTPSVPAARLASFNFEAGKLPALPVPGATSSFQSNLLQGGVSEFATPDDFGTLPFATSHVKEVSVKSGSSIIAPHFDTEIKTPFGTINIDAGSLAMLFVSDNSVAIFNFDDMHRDAVHINTANRRFSLAPGRHLILTNGTATFDQLNPVEAIAYRRIRDVEIGNGLKAFTAEFSVPSAIAALKPLKQLLSSRTPSGTKLRTHLLKTVAAMHQMRPGSERFQQIMRPRVTAFQQ